MGTRTKPVPTLLVVAAVRPVTGYIRGSYGVYGSVVKKEASLSGLRGSGPSRFSGAYDG